MSKANPVLKCRVCGRTYGLYEKRRLWYPNNPSFECDGCGQYDPIAKEERLKPRRMRFQNLEIPIRRVWGPQALTMIGETTEDVLHVFLPKSLIGDANHFTITIQPDGEIWVYPLCTPEQVGTYFALRMARYVRHRINLELASDTRRDNEGWIDRHEGFII